MTTYSLIVDIDSNQYPVLKSSGYKLCISKKVNGKYGIAWTKADFLQRNSFEWTEDYQVFVQATTSGASLASDLTPGQAQSIKFGQTCVLGKDGTLNPASGTPDESGNFYLENDYGLTHVGVNEPLSGNFLPIYLSPTIIPGTVPLTPVKSVSVWFESDLVAQAVSNSIEVTYDEATSHALSYQGKTLGIWVFENVKAVAVVQPIQGYSSTNGFFYENTHVDPHTFLDQVQCCSDPQAIESATSQSDLECTVEFPTTSDANDTRAYLKQKIIQNICQVVPDKVDDLKFTVKLKLAAVTFMKEMMKGGTDEEKIQNAFNLELDGLATPPTSRKFSHSATIGLENACVFLSLYANIALDRETNSETAVVGSNIVKVGNIVFVKICVYSNIGCSPGHPAYGMEVYSRQRWSLLHRRNSFGRDLSLGRWSSRARFSGYSLVYEYDVGNQQWRWWYSVR
jgi:hypothetical protein